MCKCLICKLDFDTIQNLSRHLKGHHLTSKEYYDRFIKKKTEGICPICGKETTFKNMNLGYKTYCSLKCSNNSEEVQKKQQATTMEHFGVAHPSQNKDIIQKMQDTCVDRYGALNGHGEQQKEQMKIDSQKKFGTDHPFQSEEIKEKSKQTKIKKYGNPKFTNREKCKETMLSKYGVMNCSQMEDYITKVKQTKLEKYCDENYNNMVQNKETKQKNIEKFCAENDCVEASELFKSYGFGWYIAKIVPLIKHFGRIFVANVDINTIRTYKPKYTYGKSFDEKEIVDYIKSIYHGQIIENTRKIISPFELDIYIPEKNIAIEFNGMYWHSSLFKSKNYHLQKSLLCQELGIRLIHIYEWEWNNQQEKIKQLLNIALGSVNKIYARQCEVRLIDNKIAKPFNDATHLQGHKNAQITYGLYYKGELVQLMSFSNTKYNRNLKSDNDWEIIRGCPGSNNIVIGGVSKLFKHFVDDYKPDKVFSYCDFNKFDGNSYRKLGMEFIGYTGPNKWYIINNTVIERNPKKYQAYKDFDKIWGSGSLKFLWTK